MDNPFKSPLTAISIGPGIRGIERGVGRVVRLREIAFVEIEAFIIENLVAEMEQGLLAPAVIWSDAKTFPAHFFRGKVNLLLAGYPCQPFSNAGKRGGSEDPRHLYPYIERTIDIIRPDICFFENVRGHVTLGLREVIESLEGLGYRVHWGIFSAEETGASHKRERVFILAIRRNQLEDSNCDGGWNESGKTGGETGQSVIQQGNRTECTIRTEAAGRVGQANSYESGFQRGESKGKQPTYSGFKRCSCELANTNNDGKRKRSGEVSRERETIKGEEQRKERNEVQWKRVRSESSNISELGHTNIEGLQGRGREKCRECTCEWAVRSHGPCDSSVGLAHTNNGRGWKNIERSELRTERTKQSSSDSWCASEEQVEEIKIRRVARPNQPQHGWESPRTTKGQWETKSGMGGRVNGYKFREDFLRALGNSVYEDTAELAFKTLLKKHLNVNTTTNAQTI